MADINERRAELAESLTPSDYQMPEHEKVYELFFSWRNYEIFIHRFVSQESLASLASFAEDEQLKIAGDYDDRDLHFDKVCEAHSKGDHSARALMEKYNEAIYVPTKQAKERHYAMLDSLPSDDRDAMWQSVVPEMKGPPSPLSAHAAAISAQLADEFPDVAFERIARFCAGHEANKARGKHKIKTTETKHPNGVHTITTQIMREGDDQ